MTTDLRDQLRGYGAFHDRAQAEVVLDDVIGAGSLVRPLAESTGHRRPLGWVVAIAAFLVIAAAGTLVLVLTSGDDTTGFVDEGTTVPATTTPSVTSVPSEEASSLILTEVATDGSLETEEGTLRFTTLAFPEDRVLYPIGATRHGFIALEEGRLRWSADGLTWVGTAGRGSWFTIDDDDVYVHGPLGPIRYTWDGEGWVEVASSEGIGWVDDMAFGPQGTVAVRAVQGPTAAAQSEIYYLSADGLEFSEASNPPSPERLPQREPSECTHEDYPQGSIGTANRLLGIEAGFLSLTSAHSLDWGERPICEPLLWFSPDGDTWQLTSTDSPFGPDAVIDDVVESASTGRFVAFGGQTAWWSDDALTWHRIERDFGWIEAVAAGPRGWVMAADHDGQEDVTLWFSPNGNDWDGPYPGPDAYGPGFGYASVAATADVIFGVGRLYAFEPAIGRWQPGDQ